MIEFIRGVIRSLFKAIFYGGISAIPAALIACVFSGKDKDFDFAVFLVAWAVSGLLLFAFPQLGKQIWNFFTVRS